MKTEKEIWDETNKLFEVDEVIFGTHWSYNFLNDPKRLLFVLSRYKFANRMIPKNSSILELGCSEGIGATILAENTKKYVGVDYDEDAINSARKNFPYKFILDDFMGKKYGKFDSIISLDVIEHIDKKNENIYFDTVVENLNENGIFIIGTPNIRAKKYASKASQIGHINLFSKERLVKKLKKYFHQVFAFFMNDEALHTGFADMAHYLIMIGCDKR